MMFQLESLTLENFRRFEAPAKLEQLAPGVNLITGPNGAGKSTFALGLRKLFFLYHRSRAAGLTSEMIPWSAPGASPKVSARFLVNGKPYVLTKQWMKGAFARLETPEGVFDGDEAEQGVAALLGFDAVTRGEAQLQGIPGLLWVEQGAGPELDKRMAPAAGYLRDALSSAMGEVASTDGDELLVTFQQALGELRRKGSESASKGALAQASAQLASQQHEIDELESRRRQYQERVDELRALQVACATDTRDQPWLTYEQQAEQCRQAISALTSLQLRLGQEQAGIKTLDAQILFLRAELKRGDQFQASIKQRELEREHASELLNSAVVDHEHAQQTVMSARTALDRAEQVRESFKARQRIAELTKRASELHDEYKRQRTQLDQANQCEEHLRAIEQSLRDYALTESELEQLRQWDQEMARLAGRAAAAATRLSFKLTDAGKLELDGRQISDGSEETLTKTGVLTIEGVGRISVTPGGTELEESERARVRIEKDRTQLLATRGLRSTAHAAEQLETKRQLQAEHKTQSIRLADFAPDGLAKHRQGLVNIDNEQTRVKRELDQVRSQSGPEQSHQADLNPAEFDHAQSRWEQAVSAERKAGDNVAQMRIRVEHAQQEITAAKHSLAKWEAAQAAAASDPVTRSATDESSQPLDEQLAQLEADRAVRAESIVRLEQTIAAKDPESLNLDLRRLTDSATESRRQAQARKSKRDLLAAQLSEAGAGGLEESLQQARAEYERIARRETALQVRADALAWLVKHISDRRQALTERLQAPLKARMDYYLKSLLPGTALHLGADLLPSALAARQGAAGLASGLEREPIAEQSFGTREQLSLLARLAYADLLSHAGKPTFLVVDDGVLNADNQRLEQLKRMLYDAGQRHQILIFSCHPDRWAGLGVVARELGANGTLQ